jgi:hypothetical protein
LLDEGLGVRIAAHQAGAEQCQNDRLGAWTHETKWGSTCQSVARHHCIGCARRRA